MKNSSDIDIGHRMTSRTFDSPRLSVCYVSMTVTVIRRNSSVALRCYSSHTVEAESIV